MSRAEEQPETYAEHRTFDSDFHIQVPMEKLFPYIDDDEIREKVEEFGPPVRSNGGWKGIYASEKTQKVPNAAGATTHGIAITTEEITEVMDDMNLDYVLATPPPNFPLGSGRYDVILEELVSAYNDYILEHVVDKSAGVYATLLIHKRNPEMSAQEIQRADSHPGIVGISDWISRDRPFGAKKYDPIFEELTNADLPLVLHPGAELTGRRNLIDDTLQTHTEMNMSGLAHQTMSNITNMIMTGVFDAYPDLDVLIQEGGVSWIPFMAYRGDEVYQNYPEDVHLAPRLHEMGQDYLQRLPSEYLFDHFHVTTQPVPLIKSKNKMESLLNLCNANEMFLFSTDWPHGSMDTTDWVLENRAVDEDLQKNMLFENARELFDLSL